MTEAQLHALARRQTMLFGTGPPLTPEYIAFDNSRSILANVGTFFAAAAIVVLLRCYVRLRMIKLFGVDDYIMVVALGFAAASLICFVLRSSLGLGKHFSVLLTRLDDLTEMTEVLYIQGLIMVVGVTIVKISIAYSLLRLATQKLYVRILKGTIIFLIVMTIFCVGTIVFQCMPIEAAWDLSMRPPPWGRGNAQCYSLKTFLGFGLMNSIFHIITDILFATLPIPLIWRLQLNLRVKLSLIFILSLGWVACIAAIIKAHKQYKVFEDDDWTVEDSYNVWNFIEMTLGIMAGSLPTLKPLFNAFLEGARALTTMGRSRGATGKGGKGKTHGTYGTANTVDAEKWRVNAVNAGSMRNLRGSRSDSPNIVNVPYKVEIATQPMERAEKEAWDAERDEDESAGVVRPHYMLGPGGGIVRTREISISEGDWSTVGRAV